jgi:hypothetical protein
MKPLFDPPIGYRFLREGDGEVDLGDTIKEGDIVCNDFGGPEFKIGPNHPEIGNHWDITCMPMVRKEG